MNIVPYRKEARRHLFSDLLEIQKEISDFFANPLMSFGGRDAGLLESAWTPAIDLYDNRDNLVVKADLPGLRKEDIEITIQDGTLILKGEKKTENERKEKGIVRTERFYGSVYRAVALPASVDESKAKASYKNGVLELTLPKREEAKPKQIKINVES